MPDQLQLRGGTTAEHSAFTGAFKEVTVDTSKKTAVVHDGSTVGGVPLLREDGSNSALTLGSAGTPSIKFTGDTNTGIYSPGADQVAISTGGSNRLHITSAGLVGIGTSTPQVPLDLISDASGYGIAVRGRSADNLGSIRFTANNYGATYSELVSGATYFALNVNSAERLRVDSSGRVGIGSTSPGSPLTIESSAGNQVKITYPSIASYFLNATSGGDFAINKDGTERLRIDSSGRLLVGTSTNVNGTIGNSLGWPAMGQFSSTSTQNIPLGLFHWSTYAVDLGGAGGGLGNGPDIVLGRSNSNNKGEHALVTNNMLLGRVNFGGSDGTQFLNGACIAAAVDGTPGTNDMPGRLVFSTTADGASSPTERMRIPNGGGLCVGSTVNPNALTQTSGIRLGTSTIASHDFTNITTSPVTIANGVGIGGLAFVQAYNTSTGAQYTGIIMWRNDVVAVVSESNALGFNLTYTVSGSTLLLQTASGTITGSVITFAS